LRLRRLQLFGAEAPDLALKALVAHRDHGAWMGVGDVDAGVELFGQGLDDAAA
jgi:hypothetical protein